MPRRSWFSAHRRRRQHVAAVVVSQLVAGLRQGADGWTTVTQWLRRRQQLWVVVIVKILSVQERTHRLSSRLSDEHVLSSASGAQGTSHGGLVSSHNGCMIVHNKQYYNVRPREATLSAENSGKPLGGRGSAPNPFSQRSPRLPSWWGAGCCPSTRTPPPTLDLRPFGLPQWTILSSPLSSAHVIWHSQCVNWRAGAGPLNPLPWFHRLPRSLSLYCHQWHEKKIKSKQENSQSAYLPHDSSSPKHCSHYLLSSTQKFYNFPVSRNGKNSAKNSVILLWTGSAPKIELLLWWGIPSTKNVLRSCRKLLRYQQKLLNYTFPTTVKVPSKIS